MFCNLSGFLLFRWRRVSQNVRYQRESVGWPEAEAKNKKTIIFLGDLDEKIDY